MTMFLRWMIQRAPILPNRWEWTTHMLISLNTPDFDGKLIARLAEIKSEISERKRIIQNEDNDESPTDLEDDEQFSTLSMIANLKVYFYKLDLGASLGKKNQTAKVRKHYLVSSNVENDEDKNVKIRFKTVQSQSVL